MKTTFTRIAKLGRKDPKPLWAMGLKIGEESGELLEAVNHHLGMLPHKKMKEPLMGEVADVIQNAIAIAAKAYPKLTLTELITDIEYQMNLKTDKWERAIGAFDKPKGVLSP